MVVALSLVEGRLDQRIRSLSLEHVTDARRKHSEKMRKITLAAVCALKVKAKKCLKAFVALRKQWMQLH